MKIQLENLKSLNLIEKGKKYKSINKEDKENLIEMFPNLCYYNEISIKESLSEWKDIIKSKECSYKEISIKKIDEINDIDFNDYLK